MTFGDIMISRIEAITGLKMIMDLDRFKKKSLL